MGTRHITPGPGRRFICTKSESYFFTEGWVYESIPNPRNRLAPWGLEDNDGEFVSGLASEFEPVYDDEADSNDPISEEVPEEDGFITLSRMVSQHPNTQQIPKLVVSDGGSTSYYQLPSHATELRHLISHKGMSKSRGDIFKACYRLGEKDGATAIYDLKKMAFFVQDLIEMHERGERL